MSYNATIVEVFLSSPGDVNPERDKILELAAEWNRLRSRDMKCFISVLTWEEMVAPALHARSQEAVNDQIGNTYDVYLGMMWTRLGTPTGVANSGTVEEFEGALSRFKAGEHLRIASLFKKAMIDPSVIDADQLKMVGEFKNRISKEGSFYREFSDDSSLRSIVNLLFEQIARDKDKYQDKTADTEILECFVEADQNSSADVEDSEVYGLIEIGEQFAEYIARMMEKLGEIGNQEGVNTDNIAQCTEDLSGILRFGSPNVDAVKKVMNSSARSMSTLTVHFEKNMSEIEELNSKIAELIDEDLKIRLEFDKPLEAAAENIAALKTLASAIDEAVSKLDGLILSTASLPRISGQVNKAANKLNKARSRLRELLVSLSQSINNSVNYFQTEALLG